MVREMSKKEEQEMSYAKGKVAGGWTYIDEGKRPIALVHPRHVDKFLAVPEMHEALESWKDYFFMPEKERKANTKKLLENCWKRTAQALAKAEGSQEQ